MSTYGGRLAARLDLASPAGPPPPGVLDRLADQRLTGGFKLGRGRSNVCPDCNLARTVAGVCGC